MRVSQISVYHKPLSYYQAKNVQRNCANPPCPEPKPIETISFKGRFGAWLGGIAGTAAVVVTAVLAAPAAICLAGGGAIAGAIGGHVFEDAVNGNNSEEK